MFCPNCGKELPKNTIRCPHCKEKNWLALLGDGVPYFSFGAIFLFGANLFYVFIAFPVGSYWRMQAHKALTLPLFIYGTILLTLFATIRVAQVKLQKKTSFCYNCGEKFTANIIGCPHCKNIDNLTYWGTELCLVFGIITLFGAVLSHNYFTTGWFSNKIYPIRNCTLPLLIPGIAFLIIYAVSRIKQAKLAIKELKT